MWTHMLLVAVLFISGPALAGETLPQFGIVDTMHSPLPCATFKGRELRSGQPFYFVAFDPQRWAVAYIVSRRTEPCEPDDPMDGVAYDVSLEQSNDLTSELGMGVVAPGALAAIDNDVVVVTGRDHLPITFRRCASSEGLHFFAKQNGKKLWHEYYYLNYAVDPTCSDNDFDENQR